MHMRMLCQAQGYAAGRTKFGCHTSDESKRRDSTRILRAEKRIKCAAQEVQVARRLARQKHEEDRLQNGGTTYGAGAFHELTVASGPARKKKKR